MFDARREANDQVDDDQDADLAGHRPSLSGERRLVNEDRYEDKPEQTEDRAAGADCRRAREQVARDRTAQRGQEVDREERRATVERLGQRPNDLQRVHVEAKVNQAAVDAASPSAAASTRRACTTCLSSMKQVADRVAQLGSGRRARTGSRSP